MASHPPHFRMIRSRQTLTLLAHSILIISCCFLQANEPSQTEAEIRKIARRALDLMTEPFYGTGEIGHFIAMGVQEVFQSKEGEKSSFWKQLSPEEKAALKRFIDPTHPQAPKEIVEADDYLFAGDIAAIIDPEGEVEDMLRVTNAVTKCNVCFIIISEAKRGMIQQDWDEQYKKVKSQIDHYGKTKLFSKLFIKMYNEKIKNNTKR